MSETDTLEKRNIIEEGRTPDYKQADAPEEQLEKQAAGILARLKPVKFPEGDSRWDEESDV